MTGFVKIPEDFVGTLLMRYPLNSSTSSIGPVSTPPNYPVSWIRTWGYIGDIVGEPSGQEIANLQWSAINWAQDSWYWTPVDTYVQKISAIAKNIWWTLGGIPQWVSSKPWIMDGQGLSMSSSAPPTNMAALSTFVTTLINRYNTGPGVGPIRVIETMNEPVQNYNDQPVTLSAGSPGICTISVPVPSHWYDTVALSFNTGSGATLPSAVTNRSAVYYIQNYQISGDTATFNISTTSGGTPIDFATNSSGSITMDVQYQFFCGNANDLAAMSLAIKNGVLASIDPQVLVSAPSANSNYASHWANGSDGVGGVASDHWDALSIHMYSNDYPTLVSLADGIATALQDFSNAGAAYPAYITEFGNESYNGTDFPAYGWSPERVAQDMMRRSLIFAANGVQAAIWFGHDTLLDSSTPMDDFENNATATSLYDWFSQNAAGFGMSSLNIMSDGTVEANINGTLYTI